MLSRAAAEGEVTQLSDIDGTLLLVLLPLIALQIALLVWAIVDWAKRPPATVRGNRYVWLVVMLFVNMLGPIAYLAFGRKTPPVAETGAELDADRARSAVDALYGGDRSGTGDSTGGAP